MSSGCIRLTNEDVSDLYARVRPGATVVVLPGSPAREAAVVREPSVTHGVAPARGRATMTIAVSAPGRPVSGLY